MDRHKRQQKLYEKLKPFHENLKKVNKSKIVLKNIRNQEPFFFSLDTNRYKQRYRDNKTEIRLSHHQIDQSENNVIVHDESDVLGYHNPSAWKQNKSPSKRLTSEKIQKMRK
jgi:hypothetical protein